jgi:hypothetical protein
MGFTSFLAERSHMLRFKLGVFTVATILASAVCSVTGAYEFIRRRLSKEPARRVTAWEHWLRRVKMLGAMLCNGRDFMRDELFDVAFQLL